jgi:transcriptional regulator with XRE-family HTH domain
MLPESSQMHNKRRILGEKLAQARKQKGLTLRAAAKALGTSYTWVSNTEKAQRNINALELWFVCECYNLDFLSLVQETISHPTLENHHA